STKTARSRIARANPASSAAVSPFIRSAIRNAASTASEAAPSRIALIASWASCALKFSRTETRCRKGRSDIQGVIVGVSHNIAMKIHEYQAKALLARHNVPVPRGEVATTAAEAEAAAKKIGGSVVVKAQIHAGGRGKGGGVKIAKDVNEARAIAEKILGMTLVTHQTGPGGRVVQRLLIEETLPIAHEYYLGIVLD